MLILLIFIVKFKNKYLYHYRMYLSCIFSKVYFFKLPRITLFINNYFYMISAYITIIALISIYI